MLRVNLTGVFLASQAAARVMVADVRRLGASMSPVWRRSRPAARAESTGLADLHEPLLTLTRDLAVKWARYGIAVNAIAPGWFPSDLTRVTLERHAERLLDAIPLRRFGGPDDLKGAVAFLASPASAFVTGTVIHVDGGQTAQ